jgi:hypothetical protein
MKNRLTLRSESYLLIDKFSLWGRRTESGKRQRRQNNTRAEVKL